IRASIKGIEHREIVGCAGRNAPGRIGSTGLGTLGGGVCAGAGGSCASMPPAVASATKTMRNVRTPRVYYAERAAATVKPRPSRDRLYWSYEHTSRSRFGRRTRGLGHLGRSAAARGDVLHSSG